MKQFKFLCIFFAGLFTLSIASAQLNEYTFSGSLNGLGSAPPLVENLACGASSGSFISEAIITTAGTCSASSSVFSFNASDGLQYNNASFISSTYTIHLFFKLNTFGGGYARVIDFLNSCCDAGMYILGNCLNFYPNGNVGTCPFFVDGNYYLISLVRDGSNNQIKIYVNGTLFSTYSDAANTYTSAGGTTPILFFRDDNAVQCEARAGHVRYISLSPLLSTDANVLTVWNNICTVILPITLQSFNVSKINQSEVALNWQTANEINSGHYDIERSNDASNYFSIGTVASQNGQGSHYYNFTDRSVISGMNYYRLKQVDLDGRFVYSAVKEVSIDYSKGQVQVIYSNGTWLNTSPEWINSSARLFNGNGQGLENIEINQSMEKINMERYPPGIYYLQIQKNTNSITKKIIKY
jgi:hypothetical protein